MDIHVKSSTKKQKKLAAEVALYTATYLMTTKLLQTLSYEIHLCHPKGLFSSCIQNDTHVRPKDFIMEIHKDLDEWDFTWTICHETVHLKQYARNQLCHRWKRGQQGERLLWYGLDCTDLKYDDQPWELEAELLQTPMAEGFVEYKYGIAVPG